MSNPNHNSNNNHKVTLEDIKKNEKVKIYLEKSNDYLGKIGYTEHGTRHASITASIAYNVLSHLKFSDREAELAAMSCYLHDLGNLIGREFHAQAGALLVLRILEDIGMPTEEIAQIVGAIGNHEDDVNEPSNAISAAMILADKADVHRTRVRNTDMITFDIHDRVNYACEHSFLNVSYENKSITLELTIDTKISQVAEYFEIFLDRMLSCKRAANFLGCTFGLVINKVKLL